MTGKKDIVEAVAKAEVEITIAWTEKVKEDSEISISHINHDMRKEKISKIILNKAM